MRATSEMDEALAGLNPGQREAVETTSGPLLVLAGAGTGKTRVITLRIARLLRAGVPASAILAVTFSRKAAREMRERVEALLGSEARRVTICTFHALGIRILSEQLRRQGRKREIRIVSGRERFELLSDLMGRGKGYEADIQQTLRAISKAKGDGHLPGDQGDTGHESDVHAAYQCELDRRGLMDFDDLVYRPLRIMEQQPAVADRFAERWRFILIDEYQDTNLGQYGLVRCLVGHERNLCVVGDDDQSIYGFRGADVERILRFGEEFPEARSVTLEVNYRSSEPIIAMANEVIAKSLRRIRKRLTAQAGGGAPVEWAIVANESDELDFVAQRIEALEKSGLSRSDMAILVRSRRDGASFAEGLPERGIACRVGTEGEVAADAVRILTLHQSKGLEFPVVFLPGLEENTLPHYIAVKRGGDIEEERRLFYVGVTRARERLFITTSLRRERWSRTPSRFMTDMQSGSFMKVVA